MLSIMLISLFLLGCWDGGNSAIWTTGLTEQGNNNSVQQNVTNEEMIFQWRKNVLSIKVK